MLQGTKLLESTSENSCLPLQIFKLWTWAIIISKISPQGTCYSEFSQVHEDWKPCRVDYINSTLKQFLFENKHLKRSLSHLRNLEILNLAENELTEIPNGAFYGLVSCHNINLSFNNIRFEKIRVLASWDYKLKFSVISQQRLLSILDTKVKMTKLSISRTTSSRSF